jgi:hypothetical protein
MVALRDLPPLDTFVAALDVLQADCVKPQEIQIELVNQLIIEAFADAGAGPVLTPIPV